MNKISITAAAFSALILSGCSTNPDNIQPTYVSPVQYQSYNCNQIEQEMARVSRRAAGVTGQQQSASNRDTMAIGAGLVFWPALFFLAGSDHEAELARLMGEHEALEQSAIEKECSIAATLREAREQREMEAQEEDGKPSTQGGEKGI